MKIGIFDADLLDNGTRHPNLALMKISGFYKSRGNEVHLIKSYNEDLSVFDKFFMSKVFSFTNVPDKILNLPNIEIGGTGFFFDKAPNLPDEIEHHMPDYDLYNEYINDRLKEGHSRTQYADYLDYSIGFATRGCFRKCSFCVNKKYDHVFRHSSIKEFVDNNRPYIYLWDDNFLAYPNWNEILDELENIGKPFQFRQGLDIRLMSDEKAMRLNSSHYQGDFIFAFDHLDDRELIINKVQLWKRYSAKICKMYVLSGYESQDENNIIDVFERIKILMKYGCLPYIMRHEKYRLSPYRGMYVEIARWCNQPKFFKKKTFREFCEANQTYKKNQSTNCSAYQALLDFELKFPNIANEYFDLRFEDENLYRNQYGYGRKYANKQNCMHCKEKGMCWDQFYNINENQDKFLQMYFTKEVDLQCLMYENSECKLSANNIAHKLIDKIIETPTYKIIELIRESSNREKVTFENIPQFSDLANALYGILDVLSKSNNMTYSELGQALLHGEKNNIADKKYGENQGKLAALIDLVIISKDSVSALINESIMGHIINQLDNDKKDNILQKLVLRIPIIQNAIISSNIEQSISKDMSLLAETTRTRRLGNVRELINFALNK